MALLRIKAEASDGVKPPTPILGIDGWVIHLVNGAAKVVVDGECGDGSSHVMTYDIRGEEGATLKVEVTCDDNGENLTPEFEVEIAPGMIADAGTVVLTL